MSTEATEAARKYDTEEKRRDIASHYHGGLDLERSYASALADHAAPLEELTMAQAAIIRQCGDKNAKLRALVRWLVNRSEDVIARWDSPRWKWDQHTGEFITALRKEVAAAKEQGFVPNNTTE